MKPVHHALPWAILLALSAGSLSAAERSNPADGAVSRALAMADNSASFQKATALSAGDQLVARAVLQDADGTEHVRFDRWHKGLRVIGGDTVVHQQAGMFKAASQTLDAPLKLDVEPGISAGRAQAIALSAFRGDANALPKSELIVFARNQPEPVLAYDVFIEGVGRDQTPSELHTIVDAKTGRVLDRWDQVHTAASNGTGRTLYSGSVILTTDSTGTTTGYALRDPTRGNNSTANAKNGNKTYTDTDNVWGNFTTADGLSAASDAQFGVARTWDYYRNVHGRNGIANDGRGSSNRVHYGNNYVNAYWSDSCFCMTYGDGDGVTYGPLVNIDVAGHEMSHGVTSRSANLTYSGESGGLNEATSDIFGTMVEFYANNPNDTPDYLIGEEIYLSNPSGTKALRFMFKPSLDGKSPDCYSSTLGSLNVHYSSGVANHFYYLLAEGATVPAGFGSLTKASLVCNGNTAITGIGRSKAEKVWYRALTTYMTSSTNYRGARTATLNAARDLYGAASAEYNAVAAAWSAVSVN